MKNDQTTRVKYKPDTIKGNKAWSGSISASVTTPLRHTARPRNPSYNAIAGLRHSPYKSRGCDVLEMCTGLCCGPRGRPFHQSRYLQRLLRELGSYGPRIMNRTLA